MNTFRPTETKTRERKPGYTLMSGGRIFLDNEAAKIVRILIFRRRIILALRTAIIWSRRIRLSTQVGLIARRNILPDIRLGHAMLCLHERLPNIYIGGTSWG